MSKLDYLTCFKAN